MGKEALAKVSKRDLMMNSGKTRIPDVAFSNPIQTLLYLLRPMKDH